MQGHREPCFWVNWDLSPRVAIYRNAWQFIESLYLTFEEGGPIGHHRPALIELIHASIRTFDAFNYMLQRKFGEFIRILCRLRNPIPKCTSKSVNCNSGFYPPHEVQPAMSRSMTPPDRPGKTRGRCLANRGARSRIAMSRPRQWNPVHPPALHAGARDRSTPPRPRSIFVPHHAADLAGSRPARSQMRYSSAATAIALSLAGDRLPDELRRPGGVGSAPGSAASRSGPRRLMATRLLRLPRHFAGFVGRTASPSRARSRESASDERRPAQPGCGCGPCDCQSGPRIRSTSASRDFADGLLSRRPARHRLRSSGAHSRPNSAHPTCSEPARRRSCSRDLIESSATRRLPSRPPAAARAALRSAGDVCGRSTMRSFQDLPERAPWPCATVIARI